MEKEHEEHFANQYRRAHANKLLRLFREATGQDAKTPKDLELWVQESGLPSPITPDREDFEAVKEE